MNQIPTQLPYNPNSRHPPLIVLPRLKMTGLMRRRLLLVMTASMLMFLGVFFLRFNMDEPMSLFYTQDLVWMVLGAIIWWYLFSMIHNAKIIIKPLTNKEQKNPNIRSNENGNNRLRPVKLRIMMPMISHILSLTFLVWFLIIFTVATYSEEHVVINHFNAYGEFIYEFIFVAGLTVVILIGLYYNWKRTTQDIKGK